MSDRPKQDMYIWKGSGKNDPINYQPGKADRYQKFGSVPTQNDRAGRDIAPCDPTPGSD